MEILRFIDAPDFKGSVTKVACRAGATPHSVEADFRFIGLLENPDEPATMEMSIAYIRGGDAANLHRSNVTIPEGFTYACSVRHWNGEVLHLIYMVAEPEVAEG